MKNQLIKSKSIAFILIIIVGCLELIANIFVNPNISIWGLSFFCIFLILYFLNNFETKIGLIFFVICFFTFLISGAILPYFTGEGDWIKGFSKYEFVVACNCLVLSLICLLGGFQFSKRYKITFRLKNKMNSCFSLVKDYHYSLIKMQRIAFIIFIVSTILSISFSIERVGYALQNGYVSLYLGFSSSSWGSRLEIISNASLFIGLAAYPNRKRSYEYLIIGIINPIFGFISGTRSSLMIYIVFMIFYLLSYNSMTKQEILYRNNKYRRKKKKWIIIGGIIIIVILPFLYSYGYTRANISYDKASGLIDGVIKFFQQQGESFNLVGYAVHYKNELPGTCYSFGSIIDNFSQERYTAQTVQYALEGNSFGSIITYLQRPFDYLNGYGMGTSYVAEIFYDFGYFGVIISNIVIGIVLQRLTAWNTESVITRAVMFLLFYNMLTLPRATFMSPINQLLSLSNIAVFIVILIFSYKRTNK